MNLFWNRNDKNGTKMLLLESVSSMDYSGNGSSTPFSWDDENIGKERISHSPPGSVDRHTMRIFGSATDDDVTPESNKDGTGDKTISTKTFSTKKAAPHGHSDDGDYENTMETRLSHQSADKTARKKVTIKEGYGRRRSLSPSSRLQMGAGSSRRQNRLVSSSSLRRGTGRRSLSPSSKLRGSNKLSSTTTNHDRVQRSSNRATRRRPRPRREISPRRRNTTSGVRVRSASPTPSSSTAETTNDAARVIVRKRNNSNSVSPSRPQQRRSSKERLSISRVGVRPESSSSSTKSLDKVTVGTTGSSSYKPNESDVVIATMPRGSEGATRRPSWKRTSSQDRLQSYGIKTSIINDAVATEPPSLKQATSLGLPENSRPQRLPPRRRASFDSISYFAVKEVSMDDRSAAEDANVETDLPTRFPPRRISSFHRGVRHKYHARQKVTVSTPSDDAAAGSSRRRPYRHNELYAKSRASTGEQEHHVAKRRMSSGSADGNLVRGCGRSTTTTKSKCSDNQSGLLVTPSSEPGRVGSPRTATDGNHYEKGYNDARSGADVVGIHIVGGNSNHNSTTTTARTRNSRLESTLEALRGEVQARELSEMELQNRMDMLRQELDDGNKNFFADSIKKNVQKISAMVLWPAKTMD